MLAPGTPAPPFNLPDQHGKLVALQDWLGKKHVVLFFYPADDTPGCTKQACSFRDTLHELDAIDTVVVGVSQDSVNSHALFSEKYQLPFHLLADKKGLVAKQYETGGLFGLNSRTTYVIDKTGVVRSAYRNLFNPTKHVREALNTINGL